MSIVVSVPSADRNSNMTKRCPRCDEVKPQNDFNKNKANCDGLASQCKACRAKDRQFHLEQERETGRKYRASHRDCKKEYDQNHREKARENSRKRYAANPEKRLESSRRDYMAHREERLKADRIWAANNRDKVNAGLGRRRALKREVTVGDLADIEYVYYYARNYDDTCYMCGIVVRAGKGHVYYVVPLDRKGFHTVSNLGIACARCNLRKSSRLLCELDWIDIMETLLRLNNQQLRIHNEETRSAL